MGKQDDLMKQINDLECEREKLRKDRDRLLDEWLQIACPFKPGDETKVCSDWSSKGGKPCVVDKVFWSVSPRGRFHWAVKGRLLKSNREPGKLKFTFTEMEYFFESTRKVSDTAEIKLA